MQRQNDTNPKMIIVQTTFPDLEKARQIGTELVKEKLAACVSLTPHTLSIYEWENAIHEEAEVVVRIKTTPRALEALEARLIALHPYQLPEILHFAVDGGSAAYVDWVAQQVSPTLDN